MTFLALFLALLPAARPALSGGDAKADAGGAAERRRMIESRLDANDPDGAVALGERAVRSFPDNSGLWLSLGEAYGAKARVAPLLTRLPFAKKCKAAFEKAVALDPASIEARSALFTYCLEAPALAGGDLSVARTQAGEIAKLNAYRGHLAFASLAARENDFSRAQAELRLANETAGSADEQADAKCQLALLYEKLGKKPEAIDELKEALKLRPGHAQAKSELRRLGG